MGELGQRAEMAGIMNKIYTTHRKRRFSHLFHAYPDFFLRVRKKYASTRKRIRIVFSSLHKEAKTIRLHALQGTMYDIIVFEYLRFRLSTQQR